MKPVKEIRKEIQARRRQRNCSISESAKEIRKETRQRGHRIGSIGYAKVQRPKGRPTNGPKTMADIERMVRFIFDK